MGEVWKKKGLRNVALIWITVIFKLLADSQKTDAGP